MKKTIDDSLVFKRMGKVIMISDLLNSPQYRISNLLDSNDIAPCIKTLSTSIEACMPKLPMDPSLQSALESYKELFSQIFDNIPSKNMFSSIGTILEWSEHIKKTLDSPALRSVMDSFTVIAQMSKEDASDSYFDFQIPSEAIAIPLDALFTLALSSASENTSDTKVLERLKAAAKTITTFCVNHPIFWSILVAFLFVLLPYLLTFNDEQKQTAAAEYMLELKDNSKEYVTAEEFESAMSEIEALIKSQDSPAETPSE